MDTEEGVASQPIKTTALTTTNSADTTIASNGPAQSDTPLSSSSEGVAKTSAKGDEIEEQKLRFDKPFLAAHSAYTKSQPHPERDLIDQYGLTWLARTVARTDPVTGEKINKIRKSYEGQIKAFALAGRNKATKWDPSQGHSIAQLAQAPAEDYFNARIAGKEVLKGLSSASQSRLQKILELTPGLVPRNAEWENVLGIDKTKGAAEDIKIKKQETPREAPQANAKINGHVNGINASSKDSEAIRPKRAGKKRRYNDESFEGYGEGYDEDDDGSSDEGSRRSISSRQKRQKSNTHGLP